MYLIEAEEGQILEVKGIRAGYEARTRLENMGVVEGVKLKVVKMGPAFGPVLVEIARDGNRVALGRGLASKVEVTPVAE